MPRDLCGIDEAGRGPIAGDLVMAGCVLSTPIDGLADSKMLSATKREKLYEVIVASARFHIVKFSAATIDSMGLSKCLACGLKEIKHHMPDCDYLFDGNSTFGVDGITTMVQADKKVAQVSAASILAKVTRDRDMVALANECGLYEFEKHKGYITKRHVELIKKHGYSIHHRRSYRLKELQQTLF